MLRKHFLRTCYLFLSEKSDLFRTDLAYMYNIDDFLFLEIPNTHSRWAVMMGRVLYRLKLCVCILYNVFERSSPFFFASCHSLVARACNFLCGPQNLKNRFAYNHYSHGLSWKPDRKILVRFFPGLFGLAFSIAWSEKKRELHFKENSTFLFLDYEIGIVILLQAFSRLFN